MGTTVWALGIIVVTVVQARRRGKSWDSIWSFPSQWLNYAIGGEFEEPFSAVVGKKVRDDCSPKLFWILSCTVIDAMFWIREWNHCAESLYRLEKITREHNRNAR